MAATDFLRNQGTRILIFLAIAVACVSAFEPYVAFYTQPGCPHSSLFESKAVENHQCFQTISTGGGGVQSGTVDCTTDSVNSLWSLVLKGDTTCQAATAHSSAGSSGVGCQPITVAMGGGISGYVIVDCSLAHGMAAPAFVAIGVALSVGIIGQLWAN